MNVKYIFCISTGRSGTAYLSKLLSQLNDCNAYHEQKPLLHNKLMRDYLGGNKEPLMQELPKKLELIFKNSKPIYVDTSHIFIKSFGWEIPHHIPHHEIGVIILKRDKENVSSSTQRVHSGPFTYLGRKWILAPYKKAIVKPPINGLTYNMYRYVLKGYWILKGETKSEVKKYPRFFNNKSLELINWYYDEIYALGNKFQKTFPKINYLELNLDELNKIDGFEKIVKAFRLEAFYDKELVKSVIGKPTNLKSEY